MQFKKKNTFETGEAIIKFLIKLQKPIYSYSIGNYRDSS